MKKGELDRIWLNIFNEANERQRRQIAGFKPNFDTYKIGHRR